MVYREIYMDRIRQLINKDEIKVLTGIRRSGKSYLLNLIKEELIDNGVKKSNIIYINFDMTSYRHIHNCDELDNLILEKKKNITGKFYLMFDEIQNVENWELSIKGYFAEFDCDIYITGSNSKLLSGELATYLTGRYREIKIYPFSFNEFLKYNYEELNIQENETGENQLFREYLEFGGMPSTLQIKNSEKTRYLEDLYNSIFYSDIIERYNIQNTTLLNQLTLFLVSNIGNKFSAKSIVKYLKHEHVKASEKTIYTYLKYIENSCFIIGSKKEDINSKNIFKRPDKFYLADHGFYTAMLGEYGENIGQILENIVYLEFLRHEYYITIGSVNNFEVDFVCKKNNKKVYVQVCYLLADENTVEREFRPLLKIKDNYPKYVISMDEIDFSKEGIIHLNLKNFLKDFI